MTTTCQTIYATARGFLPATPAVIPDVADVLSRIRADQRTLFAQVATETRDYFQASESLTSSAGASGRVLSLASLSRPVERIIRVDLSDGREASQVDVQDVDAELPPRYLVRGLTLIEVSNDWNTASGAPVSATITYAYGPTDLDPAGALTQAVSVPDEWVDLLVLPLTLYLAQREPTPQDVTGVQAMLAERRHAFLSYLKGYGGVESRRFDLPSPTSVAQKQ